MRCPLWSTAQLKWLRLMYLVSDHDTKHRRSQWLTTPDNSINEIWQLHALFEKKSHPKMNIYCHLKIRVWVWYSDIVLVHIIVHKNTMAEMKCWFPPIITNMKRQPEWLLEVEALLGIFFTREMILFCFWEREGNNLGS
jgi:hypothetical protein